MWRREDRRAPGGGFWTPPPTWNLRKRVYAAMPNSERKRTSSIEKQEPFHMIHKVPSGDSPYVRAKHAQVSSISEIPFDYFWSDCSPNAVDDLRILFPATSIGLMKDSREQLISKDPDRAIALFWAAINAGDRVDSALKDMAVVMKQLNRSDEGIEAIKSFRYLCPFESQDSIDNLLLELYKKSGRIQEEAELLEHKLKSLEQDTNHSVSKRCHGKQINMTIEQEKARILGNLAWVQLQLHNYGIAEKHYRKALSLEPDNNKQCNLAICLMRMDRITEAKSLLDDVRQSLRNQKSKDEPFHKSFERATEMLAEREGTIKVVADKPIPKVLMKSSSSDNFSPSRSSASWTNEKHGPEVGNTYKKDSSRVCFESPILISQPRECKWGDEEEVTTLAAARRLRFYEKKETTSVESVESGTNGPCITSKLRKMCEDLVKEDASGSSSAYAQIMDIVQRTV
ncbi:unnamed protein product [Thlaspi arvense]|uniref:Uncharacterized protein n=1 Tax=Thlaspi arvense TaxID=13288 RepID=A0AAU9RNT5_THLAR|nr:unnamed protein product [Thlaspi arvense]